MITLSEYEDFYGYDEPKYIKEEERYDKVRGMMDELIVQLYSDLKKEIDCEDVHYLISMIAGEMSLYVPDDKVKLSRPS